jgi:4-hydroxybenzoate polyprenyltransferase
MSDNPARWKTFLRLGRVSNLPTVWSNVLAGMVLSGAAPDARDAIALGIAISLFYTGGMFLNDAFDREVDRRERPARPIPSGHATAGEVFGIGFGLLAAGLVLLCLHAFLPAAGRGMAPVASGFGLGLAIVVYNMWHKGNPISPFLMGLCRMLVYVTAAFAASGRMTPAVAAGAAVLLSYLIGLTYVAKQENLSEVKNLWPLLFLLAPFAYAPWAASALRAASDPPGWSRLTSLVAAWIYVLFAAWVALAVRLLRRRQPGGIPRAVVRLIAAIALCDALLIAAHGAPGIAALAALAFPATLFLQRYVSGT